MRPTSCVRAHVKETQKEIHERKNWEAKDVKRRIGTLSPVREMPTKVTTIEDIRDIMTVERADAVFSPGPLSRKKKNFMKSTASLTTKLTCQDEAGIGNSAARLHLRESRI